jgi:hypothetical protein
MAQSREKREHRHDKDKRGQNQPGVAEYTSLSGMVMHDR